MIDQSLIDAIGTIGVPAVLALYCLMVLNRTVAEHTKIAERLENKVELLIDVLERLRFKDAK